MLRLAIPMLAGLAVTVSAQAPSAPADAGLSAADWTGIQAAYEAERHQLFPIEGGHRARNPGQQWVTVFDGTTALTTPDAGGWTWGLRLTGVGRAGGATLALPPRPEVQVDGGALTYRWGADVDEQYTNRPGSLKHGLIVHRRPAGPGHQVQASFDVLGDLSLALQPGSRDATFVDDAGAARVSYDALTVFDAAGRELPA